ncbi:MAG: tetratricopeptide repeat protein [Chloroflexota bacterium]|nr:tetratricopeptide repeat protein [Chloroflexota bacterium]
MGVRLGTSGETVAAFGLLIKRIRLARGWTQEELAERARVSTRLISDLERGSIHRPRRDTVQLLADGLGLAGADRESFVTLAQGRTAADALGSSRQGAGGPSLLPIPPTRLIGRAGEIEAATALLMQTTTQLLTLTGPGGVGKTRLALELGSRVRAGFPDGVFFVDLSLVDAPALVLPAIGLTFGIRNGHRQPLPRVIAARLQAKRLLVILDNFEHVVAAAPVVADLLTRCAEMCVLVTSRETLRLRAERQFEVRPLAVPDPRPGSSSESLTRNPAVDLFVNRAEAADPGFALTEETAPIVAEIVAQLDGLPLAIELAAARIKLLPPATMRSRLERRLPLLTGGARDLPARQQTMRATIHWSYDLLPVEERRMFRRLAVFEGGCALEAAEAIAWGPDDGGLDPMDGLASLLAKSLLRPLDTLAGVPRFGMFETIREFGLEQLGASGDEPEVRSRHAAWCVDLVERGGREPTGPGQEAWFARLELELPNLRAALRWSVARREAETATRLAGSLYRFWATNGRTREGSRWLEQVLALGPAEATTPWANSVLGAGVMAFFRGDYQRAENLWEEARLLFRSLEDTEGIAYALGNLGLIADVDGDSVLAAARYDEALALFRDLNDQTSVGFMLRNLGLIACFDRDYDRARCRLQAALTIARSLADWNSVAMSLGDLGLVELGAGNHDAALSLQVDALTVGRPLNNKPWLVRNLENFALIAAATADPVRAGRLFGAAAALRTEYGAAAIPKDHALFQRHIDDAKAQLGVDAFAAEWQAGAEMSLDDVITFALAHPASGSR